MKRVDNLAWLDSLPPGSKYLFEDLIAAIAHENPDVVIKQAKEKFGGLRVHVDRPAKSIFSLIDAASKQSARTCQRCGRPGELTVLRHCYETLCPEHLGEARTPSEHPILATLRVDQDGIFRKIDRS